jgi:DNA primase catalytic subunit
MDWVSIASAVGAGVASLFVAIIANRNSVRKAKLENDANVETAKVSVEQRIDSIRDKLVDELAREKEKYDISMGKWAECEKRSTNQQVVLDRVQLEVKVLRDERDTAKLMAAIAENTAISRQAVKVGEEAKAAAHSAFEVANTVNEKLVEIGVDVRDGKPLSPPHKAPRKQ